MNRLAFVLALILTLLLAEGDLRAWIGVLAGVVLVHALVRNGREARRLFVAGRR